MLRSPWRRRRRRYMCVCIVVHFVSFTRTTRISFTNTHQTYSHNMRIHSTCGTYVLVVLNVVSVCVCVVFFLFDSLRCCLLYDHHFILRGHKHTHTLFLSSVYYQTLAMRSTTQKRDLTRYSIVHMCVAVCVCAYSLRPLCV